VTVPKREPRTPVEGELPLRRRDVWALIWATYATSFPYLLAFILLFLLAIWFVTEVVFR
jgi:hypothetical protein